MTTYVLVHGAWHGGWCWTRVAARLRAAGHDVFTPTLTGLADRSHLLAPTVNLQTHVMDVASLLRWEDLEDVVLCGHSYGGMVIAGAADREAARVKAMVYLDAFVPESGQSAMDLRPKDRVEQAFAQARAHGGWMLPPTPAATFKVNEADQAWVDSKCTLFPMACFTQPLQLAGAYMKPAKKMYIRAGGYPAPNFDAPVERFRNDPAWDVRIFDCGHDVMVDMPEELAAALLELS